MTPLDNRSKELCQKLIHYSLRLLRLFKFTNLVFRRFEKSNHCVQDYLDRFALFFGVGSHDVVQKLIKNLFNGYDCEILRLSQHVLVVLLTHRSGDLVDEVGLQGVFFL